MEFWVSVWALLTIRGLVKVFLATKFGLKGLGDGTRIFSNEPDYIRKAIDTSLERLKTDRVDLWYWYADEIHDPMAVCVQWLIAW